LTKGVLYDIINIEIKKRGKSAMFRVEVKKEWNSEWEFWGAYPTRNEANEKAQIALEDNVDVFIEEI
jgi:hypothetical protein